MFISQSEIRVPEPGAAALEQAFRERARRVDGHEGFLGLELLQEVGKPGCYVLLTRWRSQADFRRYMKSGDYQFAHARTHEGVAEPATSVPLRQFQVVELEP